MFLRETKNSISVIPIFRNGTSILLDDLIFHVDKICNFIFVLDTNPISVQGDLFRFILVSDTFSQSKAVGSSRYSRTKTGRSRTDRFGPGGPWSP